MVRDLTKLDINPRRISDEKKKKLLESLEKFDLAEIPAVNKNMEIIGGNQRVQALLELGRGEEMIDVRVPSRNLTAKEVKEYAIISNTHAGDFDFEVLDAEFSDIDIENIGFDIDGWSEWQEKSDDRIVSELEEDEYEIPEELKTSIKEGDLIEIGRHKLYCGDSTNTKHIKELMGGEMADMVMTDPPYNVDYEGSNGLKISNDNMGDSEFFNFLLGFHKGFYEVTKPGGAWYVWHADSGSLNFRRSYIESGLLLKQCLIWVKNSFVMGRQDYHWQHEPCLYGWKPGAAHQFTQNRTHSTIIDDQIDIDKLKKEELKKMLSNILVDGQATTVIRHDKPSRNLEHPTMKPITLLAPLIRNSSKKGDIVCDPFLGSGSTMVACHKIDRTCYGMELDPQYCHVVVDRMKKLDPKIRVLKNGKVWKEKY